MQGYFLPPVSFTTEEANAFLLREKLVQGFADKGTQTHYTNGLNEVKSVLRTAQKEKIDILSDNIKLQLPPCFSQDFEYLPALQNAISAKTVVDLEYKNNTSEISKRDIAATQHNVLLYRIANAWHQHIAFAV